MTSSKRALIVMMTTSAIFLAGCSPDKRAGDSGNDESAAPTGAARLIDPTRAAAGRALFQQCTACHSILGDGVGPNLHGVYGRRAGSLNEFQGYSPAMKASNIVWDERQLDGFLTNPAAKVKGTGMMFPGISDAKERKEIVEFLKSY